jgi:cation transport ATPase
MRRLLDMKELLLLFSSVLWLAAGGIALLLGAELPARMLWTLGTIEGLVLSVVWIVAAVGRRQLSVDVIALLALAGALWVNEPFAGAMITVMLISGQLLEARAAARARRELSLLVERAPRTAKRRIDGAVAEVSVDLVVPGDRLLVGTGEVIPVDGRLLSSAVLDESALTGESLPVEGVPGDVVRSGVVNAGGPVELVATAAAAESTYAGIVRLVAQAQASSAPFVRMADRIAIAFVPLTLLLAGAWWWWTADPVRAVAVLVVATPCPLLLAGADRDHVRTVQGRAHRRGDQGRRCPRTPRLRTRDAVRQDWNPDAGQARLADVVTDGQTDPDELLRLAASLDQVSAHVLANSIVAAGSRRGLALEMPERVREVHGYGVEGFVSGRKIRLGKASRIVGEHQPAWVR